MAQQFLMTMTPQESEKYFKRTLPDKSFPIVKVMWSRGVQTKYSIEDVAPIYSYSSDKERKEM